MQKVNGWRCRSAIFRNWLNVLLLWRRVVNPVSMSDSNGYIRRDEHGVYRVGKTRVSLESVVYPFQRGDTAESIQQQYPSLTLEEVYGAIAYYLGHLDEVHVYLKEQEEVWEYWRKRSEENPAPVVARLRAIKASQAGRQP